MKKMILMAIMAVLVTTPCFAQIETNRVDGTLWGDQELWDGQVIQIGFSEDAVYICPLQMACQEAEVLLFIDTLIISLYGVSYNEGIILGIIYDFLFLQFGFAGSIGPDLAFDSLEMSPISLLRDDWTPAP